jgi:hypothetical protein
MMEVPRLLTGIAATETPDQGAVAVKLERTLLRLLWSALSSCEYFSV